MTLKPKEFAEHYLNEFDKYIDSVLDGTRVVGRLERLAVERWKNTYLKKYYFKESDFIRILKFISLINLESVINKGKVDQVKLAPWQLFTLATYCLYENEQSDKKVVTTISLSQSGKNGKALALDTPIITPTGWRTMGELEIGDQVFDEFGKPTNVIATSPIFINHECYELTFTNGDTIIADAEHLWVTNTTSSKNRNEKVRTTKEIFETQVYRERKNKNGKTYKEYNHSIKLNKALQFEKKELPLHPYVLGVWLGDGHSRTNQITCHISDYPEYKQTFKECGYNTGATHLIKNKASKTITFSITTKKRSKTKSPRVVLRELNVLNNKHIPRIYLESSVEDRWELLKGLMDTDGWCERKSRCVFCNTNKQLAYDVYELVRGLGIKATIKEGQAKLNGKYISKVWDVGFTAWNDMPVFKLKRKLAKQLKNNNLNHGLDIVSIKEVKQIESQPVKCITVDSPNNLFLAGKSMIPTHNSVTAVFIALMAALVDKRINANIPIICVSQKQANQILDYFKQVIKQSPALRPFFKILHSTIVYSDDETTNKIMILANDPEKVQAFKIAIAILDEVFLYDGFDSQVIDIVKSKQDATYNPLTFVIGTFSSKEHYNYDNYYVPCLNILENIVQDDSHFILFCAQDSPDEVDQPQSWSKSNPSLGVVKDLATLIKKYNETKIFPSKLDTFKTETLNYWREAMSEDRFLSDDLVNQIMRDSKPIPTGDTPVIIGVDLSSNTDVVSIAIMHEDNGVFNFNTINIIPNVEKNFVKGDIDLRKWFVNDLEVFKQNNYLPDDEINVKGYIIPCSTPVLDVDLVESIIRDLSNRYKILAVCYDNYNSQQVIYKLENSGIKCVPVKQNILTQNAPIKFMERLIMMNQGLFNVQKSPFVKWQARNLMVYKDVNNNYKFIKRTRKGVALSIDSWSAMLNCMVWWSEEYKERLTGLVHKLGLVNF